MDSEDEAMPYSKLLNENSGNYLIQNNYELPECLSVEPIFTEIGTETWSSECFPILLNGSSTNCNIKGITDHIRTEKVQGKNDRRTFNITLSHSSNKEGTLDISKNENTTGTLAITKNLELSQESILKNDFKIINHTGKSQVGKQKKTLLLLAHGNSYEISSNNELLYQIQSQDSNEKLNILADGRGCTTEIKQKIAVVTPHDHVQQKVQNADYREILSTYEYTKESDFNDSLNLNEFYSMITAVKCKVCSCLCENTAEMTKHLKTMHGDLIKSKQDADKKDNRDRPKMVMESLLNTNAEQDISLFLCSICNTIFSTRQLLMKHMEIHKQDCNVSENSDGDVIENVQNENPVYPMRNLARSLLKKQQKAMKKVKCSIKGCALKFSTNESKLRHEECHIPNMKLFRCPECKEKFTLWRICSKHLWICHKIDAGLYSCSICNKYKSNSAVLVMRHMDIHNSEKPFVCKECGKGFKQLTQLRNHRVIHKSEGELSPWSTTRKCAICERIFANDKSLKQHIQEVHEKLKPYICNVCGHKTTRKSMLELHFRQHTGDKPHICPHCTYKTADNNSLRKHVMKHYGFMQYSCPYCKYQSIQSSAYKKHLITRHPGSKEIFKCVYCNFTSVKFESYLTHVKCHEYDEEKCGTENSVEHTSVNVLNSTISTANQGDEGTPIYLHVLENSDELEEMEESENVNISAISEIHLAL